MITHEARFAALATLLKRDVQDFAGKLLSDNANGNGVNWSYRKIAREVGIAEPLVRQIDQPEWSASLKTLLKIEGAFAKKHPAWPGRSTLRFRDEIDEKGFMIRRVKDPFSGVFSEQAEAWERGAGKSLREDPRASVVSTVSSHPGDYVISRHAEHVAKVAKRDKTGVRFADNGSPVYSSGLMQDYMWCKHTKQPIFSDVLWYSEEDGVGRYYERLLLPVGDTVISFSQVHNPSAPGSVEYSANISL